MSCTWFSRNNGVKRLLVRLTCTLNYVEVMRQISLYSLCFALRRMGGASLETKYIVTMQVPSI